MRRVAEQRLTDRRHPDAIAGFDLLDWCTGTSVGNHVWMPAREIDRVFASVQSGQDRTRLCGKEGLLVGKLLLDILSIQVVEPGQNRAAGSTAARVVHGQLALPFRIEHVLPGLRLL